MLYGARAARAQIGKCGVRIVAFSSDGFERAAKMGDKVKARLVSFAYDLPLTNMNHAATRFYRALNALPEFDLAVFALLLNFPWEVLQAPLFKGMAVAPHATVIGACVQATFGDMVIMLLAHASVAVVTRRRLWILAPSRLEVVGFVAIGLGITALIEWLATRGYWFQSWTYSPGMPVIPGIEVGLSPLIQWTIVPLVTLWFLCRQSVHVRVGAGRT